MHTDGFPNIIVMHVYVCVCVCSRNILARRNPRLFKNRGLKPWLVWLSWFECHPMDQKFVSSISGQSTGISASQKSHGFMITSYAHYIFPYLLFKLGQDNPKILFCSFVSRRVYYWSIQSNNTIT